MVAADGADLRACIAGDGSAVLLLHGLGEDLDVWWERGWVGALHARHQVIAFDARGHGGSSKPHSPASYRRAVRVADAIAVLDAAGCDAVDVVGYSMGGWTALCLACDAPARVRSVIVGGAPANGQSLHPLRRALAAGLDTLRAAIERQCESLPEGLIRRFLANDPAALAAVCADDRPDLIGELSSFAAPALFFVGERDPLRPAIEASAAALRRPCRVVAGHDHFDLAVSGAALPLVLDFLAAHSASP